MKNNEASINILKNSILRLKSEIKTIENDLKELLKAPENELHIRYKGVLFEFVKVKSGNYDIGTDDPGRFSDEQPCHKVFMDEYYILKYKLTKQQFKTVMRKNNSAIDVKDLYPVVNVSKKLINIFIKRLNKRTKGKYNFQLPTEAQWEVAADYDGSYTSVDEADLHNYIVFGLSELSIGGTKRPNKLGIYDMLGNAVEFCRDAYDRTFYSKQESKSNNPCNISTTESRPASVRGKINYATTSVDKYQAAPTFRQCVEADKPYKFISFRLVCNPIKK